MIKDMTVRVCVVGPTECFVRTAHLIAFTTQISPLVLR
jgi:hypothetical protein